MPRFAANLSFLYPELPFLDRFEAAAADGFDAVECLFPHGQDPVALSGRLREFGLRLVLFNVHPGNWAAGERGLAAQPGEAARFRDAVLQSLELASRWGCSRLHVMSGHLRPHDPAAQRGTFLANLQWAASQSSAMDFLIEPINSRDMPGYWIGRQAEAHDLAVATGCANVKVQMDLYHCQIMEGDLTQQLRRWLPTGRVGHVQIAGVPDRQEPDRGELNLHHLLAELDAAGYAGHVGCEYRPRADTSEGLAWLRRYWARAGC